MFMAFSLIKMTLYRWLILLLVLLLAGLQYRLWFGETNLRDIWDLNAKIELQQSINQELNQRNSELEAEVKDLKKGYSALEERARSELGMVREGETFINWLSLHKRNRYSDLPTDILFLSAWGA